MDSKGAQALARRIAARTRDIPEPGPPPRLAAANAAPIFHWFGIEPRREAEARLSATEEPDADPTPA